MVEVNKDMIRNILTLRYHPQGETFLPKKTWKDFIEYDGVQQLIQPTIEGVIKRIFSELNPKKVGIGISGGVDSSTILCLIRKCFPNIEINSFCISFGTDKTEEKDAERASEIYSTNHKFIQIDNPLEKLETAVKIVDEPRWNLYTYFLIEEASKCCDVLFTGDGGDELFGGYVFRYKHMITSKTQILTHRYLEAHNRDWVDDQQELFAFPFYWGDIYDIVEPYFKNTLSIIGQTFLADYNGKLLYDFSKTNLLLARYFGIPLIAPFLEPEVLHIATHIPYRYKYDERHTLGKIILRQILLENFGYEPVTKGKVGWGFNAEGIWGECRDLFVKLFKSPRFVKLGLINKYWLDKGFEKSDTHDIRYLNKMLGLLALELWLKVKGY